MPLLCRLLICKFSTNLQITVHTKLNNVNTIYSSYSQANNKMILAHAKTNQDLCLEVGFTMK